jgi:hypothetical protein
MLPSLIGVIASSGGAVGGDYESIATVTVGSGGSASISFTSIPSTYQHLQIRAINIGNTGSTWGYFTMRLNGDSSSNYPRHQLWGNGSAANAYADTGNTSAFISVSSLSAGNFAGSVIDILDYANTNKYKTLRGLSGVDLNGDGAVALMSSMWQSTSAINSITILPNTSFAQYSSFALYGIKG